jgi:BlaI family transcriptional regulator, penicillinase repressor
MTRRKATETPPLVGLSARESQVLAALYRLGTATAAQLLDAVTELPSYSAVRSTLRVLQEKELVHVVGSVGTANEYAPTRPRERAARSAVSHMLDTFFEGDVRRAITSLLDESSLMLSPAELKRIDALIDAAERRTRDGGST